MTPKKQHEVENMASLIAALSNKCNIDLVVDVGSGKGYLSSYINLFYHLNVLGIDECDNRSRSATDRNIKLSNMCTKHKRTENVIVIKNNMHTDIVPDSENKCYNFPINESKNCTFTSITKHIDTKTNLQQIILHNFLINRKSEKIQTLLCGLHTCGNLATTLMKQFVSYEMTEILCNVSCCYNLLTEEFYNMEIKSNECAEFGFPLSSTLRDMKFSLGRTTCMLATQSRERMIKNKDFHRHLFYRTLFQVVLSDYSKMHSISELRVGRFGKKCSSFKDYVCRALKRLNLNLNIDYNDLDTYLDTYSAEEKKLKAFQFLRIVLAPCIETLILLDRLIYLMEQESVEEAHLVRLFDPLISPRCYGLIAIKKKN